MPSSLLIHMRAGRIAQAFAATVAVFLTGVLVASPQSAKADDAADHPVDRVLKALDLKTDPGRPADFVEASRPKAEGDFIPVGEPHPTRPIKVKTPAELKAMEADLDAARVHHDQISGRKPPPPKPAKKAAAAAPAVVVPSTQN